MADDALSDPPYRNWAVTLVAAIDRRPLQSVAVVSTAYWIFAGLNAARRALWHDEIFTYSIASLPESADVLRALWQGADNHPPLDYLIRHFFMRWFGPSEFVFRFPSLFAFWAGMICLFWFIRRRTSPSAAVLGLLILVSTTNYRYAYEGRSYAAVIACAAASLLCWQLAGEGKRWAFFGLALSLSAALYLHYYAVLLWVPLVLGEIARSWYNRRLDWRVWVAFVAAAISAIPLIPLIRLARQFAPGFWTKVDVTALLQCYDDLMRPLPLVLLTGIAVLILMPDQKPVVVTGPNKSAWDEVVAGIGYLALPAACFVLAKYFTGAFTHRYVLTAVFGVAMLIALVAKRLQAVRVFTLPVLLAGMVLLTGLRWVQADQTSASRTEIQENVKALSQLMSMPDEPIVVGDALSFAQLGHYVRGEQQARLFYVASLEQSMRFKGFDTTDRGLLGLRQLLKSPVWEYSRFTRTFSKFRLVLPASSWQKEKLVEDGAAFTQVGVFGGQPVYSVIYPVQAGKL